jgi:thiamine-phosphate pyrophosphorylase
MTAGLPRLYAISDPRAAGGRRPPEIVREFVEGGARWIQIREKELSSGAFLDEVRACVDIAGGAGARIFVNDRPDIAWLAAADGVHLGHRDPPAAPLRRILPDGIRIGISTHSVEEAVAESAAADYVAVGPIFGSPTAKQDWPPRGLEILRRLRGRLKVPIVAIGGIRLDQAAAVLEAGADSVAVIADLLRGASIRARVREFVDRLDRHPAQDER